MNAEQIKKLKKGELAGYVFAGLCGAVFVYFIVAFATAQIMDLYALRLATLIVSPVLAVVCAGLSAFFNLRCGREIDKIVSSYVQSVLIENAALMHPEKSSLTFFFSEENGTVALRVNGFKEKIIFDFTPFGKLSAIRKSEISSAIFNRLGNTFCRLQERGAKYSDVSYRAESGKKQGKPVYIIQGGLPDKKIFKEYLKTK